MLRTVALVRAPARVSHTPRTSRHVTKRRNGVTARAATPTPLPMPQQVASPVTDARVYELRAKQGTDMHDLCTTLESSVTHAFHVHVDAPGGGRVAVQMGPEVVELLDFLEQMNRTDIKYFLNKHYHIDLGKRADRGVEADGKIQQELATKVLITPGASLAEPDFFMTVSPSGRVQLRPNPRRGCLPPLPSDANLIYPVVQAASTDPIAPFKAPPYLSSVDYFITLTQLINQSLRHFPGTIAAALGPAVSAFDPALRQLASKDFKTASNFIHTLLNLSCLNSATRVGRVVDLTKARNKATIYIIAYGRSGTTACLKVGYTVTRTAASAARDYLDTNNILKGDVIAVLAVQVPEGMARLAKDLIKGIVRMLTGQTGALKGVASTRDELELPPALLDQRGSWRLFMEPLLQAVAFVVEATHARAVATLDPSVDVKVAGQGVRDVMAYDAVGASKINVRTVDISQDTSSTSAQRGRAKQGSAARVAPKEVGRKGRASTGKGVPAAVLQPSGGNVGSSSAE